MLEVLLVGLAQASVLVFQCTEYRWQCKHSSFSSMHLGPTKTIELFVGPKRFGFNELSSDFAGQIEGTKKPAGLAPCGLSGLHRMTLVITDGEFWWSWRELNPRPKFLHPRHYMLSPVFTFAGQLRTDTPLTN